MDSRGRSLYMLSADSARKSTCFGACVSGVAAASRVPQADGRQRAEGVEGRNDQALRRKEPGHLQRTSALPLRERQEAGQTRTARASRHSAAVGSSSPRPGSGSPPGYRARPEAGATSRSRAAAAIRPSPRPLGEVRRKKVRAKGFHYGDRVVGAAVRVATQQAFEDGRVVRTSSRTHELVAESTEPRDLADESPAADVARAPPRPPTRRARLQPGRSAGPTRCSDRRSPTGRHLGGRGR